MKRSKFEVRADILNQVNKGVESPTSIMYKANCNWGQLDSHLDDSVEQGLLEYVLAGGSINRKLYTITEKGIEFLSSIKKARRLLST